MVIFKSLINAGRQNLTKIKNMRYFQHTFFTLIFISLAVNIAVAQTVTISSGGLTEFNMNGAIIKIELTAETFNTNLIDETHFKLNNAPANTDISNVSYISATLAQLELTYDQTDFDASINNFSILVDGSVLSGGGDITSNMLTITGFDESLTAEASPALTELNLNGSIITLKLSEDTFKNSSILASNLSLINQPPNVLVGSVQKTSAVSAEITLSYDGTDFDIDYNDLRIVVAGSELQSTHPLTSNALTVLAVIEPASLSLTTPAAVTESSLNGQLLELTIVNDQFVNHTTLVPTDFILNNAPVGTSISGISGSSLNTADITLAYNNTDFDTDVSMSISIKSAALLQNASNLVSNNITVQAEIEPVIVNVSIPNVPMKINDVVNVAISTSNDGGTPYTLTSGNIGGFSLFNLQRVSAASYTANFVVSSGGNNYAAAASIPVNDIVISNGQYTSEPYSQNIVQNNDPVDAKRPVVNSLSIISGSKKIGESLILIVDADDAGYAIDPSSTVNDISISSVNMTFTEIGSGNYTITYTVSEGDNDVAPGALSASVVLIDPAGNKSLPYTNIATNTVSIDANSPEVLSMTVNPGNKGIGDLVEVTINTDGNNYMINSASSINGVPISSPRVNFTHQSGNTYLLTYLVDEVDNSVAAGNLQLNLVLNDQAGNTSQAYTQLESNTVIIFATLPTATITGATSICEGDSTQLIISLSGVAPWDIVLNEGGSLVGINGIATAAYTLKVIAAETINYSVVSVTDASTNSNTGEGSATITVKERPDVSFTGLNPTYSVSANPVLLQGSPAGGNFSGPGVLTSNNTFYPAIAGIENSPHRIIYFYTDPVNGCSSSAAQMVNVIDADGDIIFPENRTHFCGYDDTLLITGVNLADDIGEFAITGGIGLVDNGDNTAILDPSLLEDGVYNISYTYFDGDFLTLEEQIEIEILPEAQISGISGGHTCTNEPATQITGNITGGIFSGKGVTGDAINGFWYNPGIPDAPATDTVRYHYVSTGGCVASDNRIVNLSPAPNSAFSVNNNCLSGSINEPTHFVNQTTSNEDVSTWAWVFGDVNSGQNNFSNLESPSHFYSTAGARNIRLTATTVNNCSDLLDTVITFGDKPVADFTWDNECYDDEIPINFSNLSTSVNEIIENEWSFPVNNDIITFNTDSFSYLFPQLESYNITLQVETNKGCRDTVSRTIYLRPNILLAEQSYLENFEGNATGWVDAALQGSVAESWTLGQPAGDVINRASSGTQAWYTSFSGTGNSEQSVVTSPCFDFSDTERPFISLDIWRAFDRNRDGTSLQTSSDGGKSWQTIGAVGDGINWYNSFEIINGPGGNGTGWTGEPVFNPDDEWKNARYKLDMLRGKKNVRFRVAYGSDGNSQIIRDGFAFDDFYIGERTQRVLIEYFTNEASLASLEADEAVNEITDANIADVMNIQYHTAFPGYDRFNVQNQSDPAVRVLFYGVSSVPYAITNGGFYGQSYNFAESGILQNEITRLALRDALFDVSVSGEISGNNFNVGATVTANTALENVNMNVFTAILEKSVVADVSGQGEVIFENILKDILPDAAGFNLNRDWNVKDTEDISYSWPLQNTENPENLVAVVFIQDEITREIYQAGTSENIIFTSSEYEEFNSSPKDELSFNVYPVPANERIYIDNPHTNGQFTLSIYTHTGKLMEVRNVFFNQLPVQVDVEQYNAGVYILRMEDLQGKYLPSMHKIIITK